MVGLTGANQPARTVLSASDTSGIEWEEKRQEQMRLAGLGQ